MHILYIHQYFFTPEESGATRSYWIAKKMLERGHKVTMITSTNNKLHKLPQSVNVDGINVVYVKNEYDQKLSKTQKIISFIRFVLKSIWVSKSIKGVDIVFATSTPLTVGITALYLKKIKGLKYIFEVRDLWPDFPIQIGAIKSKYLIKSLKKLEKYIYDNAEYVVGLSPGMTDGVIDAGKSSDKVITIPNMSKPDLFYPREMNVNILRQYGIDIKKLNVVHFGSMGVANGLEHLLDAAKILKGLGDTRVHFFLVGKGSMFSEISDFVEINSLTNISLVGDFNLYDTSDFVNCCDISFVSFKDLPILYTNSPNKLFDSLSAGKPIIVNSAGWTKDLVESNNCGYYVSPKRVKDLTDLLLSIDKQSESYHVMCVNSRSLSINKYDKNILTSKMVDLIERVCIKRS